MSVKAVLAKDDEAEEDENEADVDEFAAGDAVGKGLALINQIRKSPQAQAYSAKTCKTLEIPTLQLIGWIRTRWASLYAFLDRILLLQTINSIFECSMTSVHYRRSFSNGSLTATLRRNRPSPEMFEALQILKSAYRNGHIGASEEARKRMIDFLMPST
ncbi:hypothetical protein FB451DRAFT_1396398 [Mycena latifolia]|nr:hypothetical protein FB451DRAFT_1396398 [Mycena latifolia]